MTNTTVAYITTSFAALSHTFIRREVTALERIGCQVELFGVRPDRAVESGDEGFAWHARTAYLYPLSCFQILKCNGFMAFRHPIRYLRGLLSALANEERNLFLHLKCIYHFFLSATVAAAVERRGCQHIHAHFLNVPSTIAMFASASTGIPYSITVHSAGTSGMDKMTNLKAKLRRASFVRAISDYGCRDIKQITADIKSVHVIRCGLDLPDSIEVLRHREIDGNRSSPVVVLGVGRFVEKKGFRYLIDALAILRSAGFDARLELIGDGPLRADLLRQVADQELGQQVKWWGALSPEEVRDRLERAHIVVVPSVEAASGEKEGMPVVVVEALAAGRPVIATRHAGIPEVIQDRVTGILVSERDSQAIADAIVEFTNDQALREQCVQAGIDYVCRQYDVNVCSRNLKQLFVDNLMRSTSA